MNMNTVPIFMSDSLFGMINGSGARGSRARVSASPFNNIVRAINMSHDIQHLDIIME